MVNVLKILAGILLLPIVLVAALAFVPALLGAGVWEILTGDSRPARWLTGLTDR